jgi:phospholipid/cholesterol/gamma-HCH transport system permease protein
MVLNEEIDARVVLGADPVPSLVAPRAIACAFAVPLLTVILDAFALLGSMAAELALGNSSTGLFWNRTLVFLTLHDVIPATLKTAVFGWLVGLLACWTGLNAGPSTESVGHAAIQGVVRSIFGVFAANLVLVPCIQAVTIGAGWARI